MKIYIQLIENSLQQQVPAIWLSTFNHNYIFNVPSSFSRFVRTHNRRIPKKPILFFTKVQASTVVGLESFIQDMFFFHKGMETKLYVPQQIYNYLEYLRNKMGYRMIPFSYSVLSCQKTASVSQSRLGIKQVEKIYEIYQKDYPMSILQNLNNHILQNIQVSGRNDSSLLINKDGEFENQDVRIKPFQITDGQNKCINYLCYFHKVQGKVLADKISQLNIPFIKIKELLENGQISLEGRTILSSEIKQEDYLGPCLLIFHISSAKSIQNISNHPAILQYLNQPYRNTTCVHIVEGLDTSIVESQQFKSFLSLLNSKQDKNSPNSQPVKHLIYNRRLIDGEYQLEKENQNQHIAFIDFIREQKFECVPDITSNYQNFIKKTGSIKLIEKIFGSGMASVRMFGELFCYKRCYELILSPLHNTGYRIGHPLDNPLKRKSYSLIQMPTSIPTSTIPSSLPHCNFTKLNPTVSILGTSSTRARMMRNVSCIYMQVCEGEGIILDCGEGSYHQLLDHFGIERTDEILLKTKILFITHFHSDHSLGILELISQRNKLIQRIYNHQGTMEEWREQNKMFLIVPYSLAPWLETFNKNIQHFTKGCHLLFTQTILNQTTEYIFKQQHNIEKTEKSNKKISQRAVHNIVKKKSKMYNQKVFKDAIENQDDCEADNQRMELLYVH